MTDRKLRSLAASCFVFCLFMYCISLQVRDSIPINAPDAMKTGGPLSGLTSWQLKKFQEGKALFAHEFSVNEGLGPLYNGASCSSCHGENGTVGGAAVSAAASYVRLAKRRSGAHLLGSSKKINPAGLEEKDLDFMEGSGGPILLKKTISDLSPPVLPPGCVLPPFKVEAAEIRSPVFASQIYGLGLVDAVDDLALNFEFRNQLAAGREQRARIANLQNRLWNQIGRFGCKCRHASLFETVASELGTEIGISTPFFPHSPSKSSSQEFPACLRSICPSDPNNDGLILNKINFYISLLAPPPRGEITASARRGEAIFSRVGCIQCHVSSMKTRDRVFLPNPDGPAMKAVEMPAEGAAPAYIRVDEEPRYVEVRALEKRIFQPYSDFLLHDMGPGLADAIPATGCSSSFFRSAPLWGLRLRKLYLHDGRARKIEEAIKAHGGESGKSAGQYGKLSDSERKDLLSFLNSL